MTETFQPVDLLAIALALAALIGCINYLWVKLPPAIGMLLGSLVLSLIIVSSDRLFHLHVMTGLRATLTRRICRVVPQRRAGAAAVRRQPACRHCGIEPAARHDPAAWPPRACMIATTIFGAGMWLAFSVIGMAVPLIWCVRARRHPGADRRGRGRDLAASGRAAAEPARRHRRREPVQRRRRRGAVPAGAGRHPGRDRSISATARS